VSRTPIREALQRLVNEGLAETGAGGVSVAVLSVEDIRDLEQANRALQSLAAELASAKGSAEDMAKLDAAVSAAVAWPVVRKNSRRLRMEVSFIDTGLSVLRLNSVAVATV